MSKLAARIRSAREKAGLSLRELARRIEISATYMHQIETGDAPPSEACLELICEQIGCDFDALMRQSDRIPTDVRRYITKTPGVLERLRREMARSKKQSAAA